MPLESYQSRLHTRGNKARFQLRGGQAKGNVHLGTMRWLGTAAIKPAGLVDGGIEPGRFRCVTRRYRGESSLRQLVLDYQAKTGGVLSRECVAAMRV
jgi:hypothetical protein